MEISPSTKKGHLDILHHRLRFKILKTSKLRVLNRMIVWHKNLLKTHLVVSMVGSIRKSVVAAQMIALGVGKRVTPSKTIQWESRVAQRGDTSETYDTSNYLYALS
ncbi:hypothetical protein H5410_040700, partial [Solanum commersonii]